MLKFLLLLTFYVWPIFSLAESVGITMAGSSTVYPFAIAVAENVSKKFSRSAPLVESIGTGNGIKLFCSGRANIANASRAMSEQERKICLNNNINPVEFRIGYDLIVLITNKKKPVAASLSSKDLFLAIAGYNLDNAILIANQNKYWQDIKGSLPKHAIKLYGPSIGSGTRDIFTDIVMAQGAKQINGFDSLSDEDQKKMINSFRRDGNYVDAGTNDVITIKKVNLNPYSLGIIGYSYLLKYKNFIKQIGVDGKIASDKNIRDRSYPLLRSLYLYVDKNNNTQDIIDIVAEFFDYQAIGKETGYLSKMGLIGNHMNDVLTRDDIVKMLK